MPVFDSFWHWLAWVIIIAIVMGCLVEISENLRSRK